MQTKPITEVNINALKKNPLTHRDSEVEPVKIELDFYNYSHVINTIANIFEAIEIIGTDSSEANNLFICSTLASVGKKLLPQQEAEFLDDLLLKSPHVWKEQDFKNVASL